MKQQDGCDSPIQLWWSGLSPADRERVQESVTGTPLPPDLVAEMGRFHIEAIHRADQSTHAQYHLPTVVRDFVLSQRD